MGRCLLGSSFSDHLLKIENLWWVKYGNWKSGLIQLDPTLALPRLPMKWSESAEAKQLQNVPCTMKNLIACRSKAENHSNTTSVKVGKTRTWPTLEMTAESRKNKSNWQNTVEPTTCQHGSSLEPVDKFASAPIGTRGNDLNIIPKYTQNRPHSLPFPTSTPE